MADPRDDINPAALIEAAIDDYLGPRCEDFDASCPTCRAWAEWDRLAKLREGAKPVAWRWRYRNTITNQWSNWIEGKGPDEPNHDDEIEEQALYPHPTEQTDARSGARDLIDMWRAGAFEDGADAAAQDRADRMPPGEYFDASLIIEAWLDSLPPAFSPAAPEDRQEAERHPLEVYADSYASMARDGDGRVDCRSCAVDGNGSQSVLLDGVQAGEPLDTGFHCDTSGGSPAEALRDVMQQALAYLATRPGGGK